jgi:hypothetical protein
MREALAYVLDKIDFDHFRARVLQDALTAATADYWEHRAQQFEHAAPRKGDFHGHASREELLNRWESCRDTANACRVHAQLLRDFGPEPISDEVWASLRELV